MIFLRKKLPSASGISSLPVVLLLSSTILTFAIGAALLIFLLNNANLGERLTDEALISARAGVEDGILRVVRNKNCPNSSCMTSPSSYTMIVNARTVTVTICKDACDGSGKTTITSVASAGVNNRQIKAILEVDAITGQALIESIKETAL